MSAEEDRAIMDHYGIDAEGTSTCGWCDLRHYSGMDCPPVLPLGTDSASWWLGGPA